MILYPIVLLLTRMNPQTKIQLQDLSLDEQMKIFYPLSEIFRKKAITIALENLHKNDLDKFKNLLLNKTIDQNLITDFIIARISNFETIFKSEIEKFYIEFFSS